MQSITPAGCGVFSANLNQFQTVGLSLFWEQTLHLAGSHVVVVVVVVGVSVGGKRGGGSELQKPKGRGGGGEEKII